MAVEHMRRALLVGLHDEADAVPARQARVKAQGFQQVEREFQPVGFLGIDVQADIVLAASSARVVTRGSSSAITRSRCARA
jgi:hypothetical protein